MNELLKLAKEERIAQVKIDIPSKEDEQWEIRLYDYIGAIPVVFSSTQSLEEASGYTTTYLKGATK